LFTSLAHELIVSRANALEYLEGYRIDSSERDVFRAWMAGGASYLGTTLATGQDIDSARQIASTPSPALSPVYVLPSIGSVLRADAS
jgi:hypothetical protein